MSATEYPNTVRIATRPELPIIAALLHDTQKDTIASYSIFNDLSTPLSTLLKTHECWLEEYVKTRRTHHCSIAFAPLTEGQKLGPQGMALWVHVIQKNLKSDEYAIGGRMDKWPEDSMAKELWYYLHKEDEFLRQMAKEHGSFWCES